MKIYFIYQTKKNKPGRVVMEDKPIVFGRMGSQVNLEDEECSRRHCMIRFERNELIMDDLESKNGTMVNGVKTASCRIFIGDLIKIGSTKIMLDEKNLTPEQQEMFRYKGDQNKRKMGDVTLQLDNNIVSRSTSNADVIKSQAQNKLIGKTKKDR